MSYSGTLAEKLIHQEGATSRHEMKGVTVPLILKLLLLGGKRDAKKGVGSGGGTTSLESSH